MLKAILFDFDGVIADTEPIHFRGFQKILREKGVVLTRRDYYAHYLGYNDRECFQQIYRDRRMPLSAVTLKRLILDKTRTVKSELRTRDVLLSGARRAVKILARRYRLAIISGALREEILLVLRRSGLRPYFKVIIAADDVRQGKPNPEGFLKAWRCLRQEAGSTLRKRDCLVIEDSHWGIDAARRAGMACVALTSSYPRRKLRRAHLVLEGLHQLKVQTLPKLQALCPDSDS